MAVEEIGAVVVEEVGEKAVEEVEEKVVEEVEAKVVGEVVVKKIGEVEVEKIGGVEVEGIEVLMVGILVGHVGRCGGRDVKNAKEEKVEEQATAPTEKHGEVRRE